MKTNENKTIFYYMIPRLTEEEEKNLTEIERKIYQKLKQLESKNHN